MRVIDLPKEASRDAGALVAEVATASLMGGRRAVRVRDAGEAFIPAVEAVLGCAGPGIAILEAPGLPRTSRLRSLIEAAPLGAAVVCSPEGDTALAAMLGAWFMQLGVDAEPGVMERIAARYGADRLLLRRECEKLAAYVGRGGRVDDAAVDECAADRGVDGDGAVAAAFVGDIAGMDAALNSAFEQGANAVQILRSALAHVQRVRQQAGGGRGGGWGGPPLSPKQSALVRHATRLWDTATLEAAAARLLQAERRAKSTGIPELEIARGALAALARQASRRR